jgi:PAS domain S-box-containing protein
MACLIRAFDWEASPLGPMETWSDTLVTTVNLLLASSHPMFLWWGADLIQFYNDGYRPSIRADKHPAAIGQRGTECWPEIWTIIGPQIDAVMSQGRSTWNTNQLIPINRNGKLEEVYWTYSYSPVRDKDGTIHGTLVVCSETTEQVLSERRFRTLLGIDGDSSPESQPRPQPLLSFAQRMVKKLDKDQADIPFAAFYVWTQCETLQAGSAELPVALADPARWSLAGAVGFETPLLVDDLKKHTGNLVCEPWPEPVTRAYVMPLRIPASSVQAALVFGISPRLPFDENYRTFFQLVGVRIAALLQSEIHEQELAEAAARFSSLVEANPFGMVIGSLNGELKYVNPAFLETLGYSQAEVGTGMLRWDDLTPPEYAAADAHAVEQLLALGRYDVYEKAFIAKDGRRVSVLIGASTLEHSGRDPEIAAFLTDLTPLKMAEDALRKANDELEKKVAERTAALEAEVVDRKRAEMGLRELSGRLLVTQDEERRYMARELHDHAGQTLAVLAMNLSALQRAAKDQDSKIVTLAADSQQLSEDLLREVRTFSYLLHPPLLDEVGLLSALRWYVDGFSERSKIDVTLDLPSQMDRLPKDLELVIFRVVQESLTNIHRHSGSPTAKIHLASSQGAVEFEVSDRGKGISAQRQNEMTTAKAGVGVRGMEERIRQFGGTLHITSNQEGTKVIVRLPVTPPSG